MYKNFMELDENTARVDDDKNNVKIISKENDLEDLKDIVALENEIETSINLAVTVLEKQMVNKRMEKLMKVFTIAGSSLIALILGISALLGHITSGVVLSVLFSSYIIIPRVILGSKEKREERFRKTREEYNEIEDNIKLLQAKLENMKSRSKYSERAADYSKLTPHYSSIVDNYYYPDNSLNVLKLTKK